jgi:C-terminal processing protease CtpA/Prc
MHACCPDFKPDSGLIKPGDLIMEIDGVDATTLSVNQATEALRGPPGSTVRLVAPRILA